MKRVWGRLLIFTLILSAPLLPARADEVPLVLITEDFLLDAETGIPVMNGFSAGGAPGNPLLPQRIINWALPPNALMGSVKLEILNMDVVDSDGTFDLPPAPPLMTCDAHHTPIVRWGETPASAITNGRNTAVYLQNAFYPAAPVTLLPYGQLRKWQFARIAFSPLQYNPVTRRLRRIQSIELAIHFDTAASLNALSPDTPDLLSDNIMTDRAAELLDNFDGVYDTYQSSTRLADAPLASSDYAIITTTTISNHLTELPNLIQHLTHQGHTVTVVTENDFGSLSGQSPNGTAEKIRQWLINQYASLGIEYVLLIGSPDPDDPSDPSDSIGEIPMKMCWPCRTSSSDKESPTDYFYADLTGNWDLDGDGYFGEYVGDSSAGGVDFTAEVLVGRIPIYDGNYSAANTIIRRMIDYETDTNSIAWRKRMLLPMAVSNYENEDNEGSSRSDGRNLPKLMINNVLIPRGHSYHVMYEKTGLSPVPDSADYDNTAHIGASETNLVAQWNNGYGTVLWWGHGSETAVFRKYWNTDDGNGIPEEDEMEWPELAYSSMMNQITSTCPALVYMSSCNCGYPENWVNLGYAALRDQAVGVIAASRVSWYLVGTWSVLTDYADNSAIGYQTMKRLISSNYSIAQSLYDSKSYLGNSWGAESWMNKMDFNLYGLPSISLTNITAPTPLLSVTASTPTARENGGGALVFDITSTEITTNAFALSTTLSGGASEGSDYTNATSVTFPAGTNALTIRLYPINDDLTEGPESIVFTILPNPDYQLNGPGTAYAHILDDEEAVIATASPTVNADPATQNSADDNFDFDLSGGALSTFDQGGFGSFGHLYLNADETALYIGGIGCSPNGTNNALLLFLSMDSLTDDAENLWSGNGLPNGLDLLHNVAFSPAADVAILIGDEWGDGTYTNFAIESGYDMGQGIFYLNSVFTPVAGAALSQFDGSGSTPTGSTDADGNRQTDRWEARIPFASLNASSASALGNLHVSGLILGDSISGNDRYLSGNILGAGFYCSAGLNEYRNFGFNFVTLTGQSVSVAAAGNTSPTVLLTSPRSGAEFIQGQAISFSASATDPEDGPLTNILWHSLTDGLFAQGIFISFSTLSTGLQTITASAVDSASATGSASIVLTIAADSETNGLPDAWEEIYWTQSGESSASEDSDADGMNNAEEWLAGTDPTDASIFLTTHATRATATPASAEIQWYALSNRQYSIWYQTNLLHLPMTPLVTNLQPPATGPMTYTDLVHQADQLLFYRIKVEQ